MLRILENLARIVVLRIFETPTELFSVRVLAHRTLLAAAVVMSAATFPAFAQMYTWKDPETGQTQMSNVAPPWYRANQPAVRGAPRTQVLLNGNVIDDTGVQASPDHKTNVNTQLENAARQRAEEARSQQMARQQAVETQRQSNIAQLRRQRMDLMAKIAGGPLVAGKGPFDVASVAAAANRLAEVNRELNALDPGGAAARAEEQKRALGAVAKARQQELEKQRDRDAVRGAVREGTREAITDCVRAPYLCR